MKYYNDIKELIGNTPLIKLNNFNITKEVNVFSKLEYYNPAGSIKDRIGLYMIEEGERAGVLRKGMTIIEATAGNTGLGLAIGALNKGYKTIFVVPDKFSDEKIALMKALGGEVIITPKEKGMKGAIEYANTLLQSIENSTSLHQFENAHNPEAHYYGTGREIYEDLDGVIDYFVAGAGSGGTFTGVMKYLKEKNPKIKGVLVDPEGSTMGGGEEGPYNIEGIGNNFIPAVMDMSLVSEVIKVNDEEAFGASRELSKKEGIIVGTSSGAAMAGVLKLIKKIDRGNIVTLFPDRGDRYFSKGLFW
ncbi:cysteine synthase family protein [Hathewaya histolytica]|uniref:Cysteine synthase n=1 Tax=Hathewaya histolytica TaxID=1498 RepID=A0A4U9R5D0_HATHI|nr:cysteine synthase family protein [Hathewaya histolytica]VTQ85711.1 cysteine synthase [Hathewaya histolytica]